MSNIASLFLLWIQSLLMLSLFLYYQTLSGQVMRQTWGTRTLDFVYDDSNQPYALIYKSSSTATPVLYYYVLNQQGDVMALMNTSGAIVAQYQYDPWGVPTVQNPSGTTNTSSTFIGNLNPLRYRGYYYDTETGFYYLQSRYYDPAIGRFISADTFASTGQGFLGCNMFAYCNNDPVNMTDNSGCDPVPAWAKRIINGSATEADYQKALSVNAAAWNGSARYTVDEAISIAREHQSIMTAEHHKRGTTNKSNQQKHEKGQSRKQRDNNGEKGDARRKPNPNKRRPLSIQRMISLTIAVGATIGVIYLVANDITGVGIADDAAIAPLVPIILDNVGKAFS